MRTKEFKDKRYPWAKGYRVSTSGHVIKPNGEEANYHRSPYGGYFVRIAGEGNLSSVMVGYMVLQTYKPHKGRKPKVPLIAMHKDGDPLNDNVNNLVWGTRKLQSDVAMTIPKHFKRVRKMGKANHNGKKAELIKKLWRDGKDYDYIQKKTGASLPTVYKYKVPAVKEASAKPKVKDFRITKKTLTARHKQVA